MYTAIDDAVLHIGDTLLVVGTWRGLEQFTRVIGSVSEADLMKAPGTVTHRKIVVTHKAVLGKTLAERGLDHLYNVAITLFLACVGLKAGAPFFRTVFTPEGLWWIIGAVGIAMIPLLASR